MLGIVDIKTRIETVIARHDIVEDDAEFLRAAPRLLRFDVLEGFVAGLERWSREEILQGIEEARLEMEVSQHAH